MKLACYLRQDRVEITNWQLKSYSLITAANRVLGTLADGIFFWAGGFDSSAVITKGPAPRRCHSQCLCTYFSQSVRERMASGNRQRIGLFGIQSLPAC